MPGVNVTVTDRCAGCGTCAAGICFVDAIRLVDGCATIGDACRGCGRCVEASPNEAIALTIGVGEPVSHTIARLASLVDGLVGHVWRARMSSLPYIPKG